MGLEIPPISAVSNAVLIGWIVETIFPIEAAGTLGKSGIELVHYHLVRSSAALWTSLSLQGSHTIICRGNHENAIIVLQSVDLVEEIAAHLIRD